MNTEKAQQIISGIEQLDREIEAMEAALEAVDGVFEVVGGDRYKRPARVEITRSMAEPFLVIGLKSLKRRRGQMAARLRDV